MVGNNNRYCSFCIIIGRVLPGVLTHLKCCYNRGTVIPLQCYESFGKTDLIQETDQNKDLHVLQDRSHAIRVSNLCQKLVNP